MSAGLVPGPPPGELGFAAVPVCCGTCMLKSASTGPLAMRHPSGIACCDREIISLDEPSCQPFVMGGAGETTSAAAVTHTTCRLPLMSHFKPVVSAGIMFAGRGSAGDPNTVV
jgi:hypothetical protein